MKAQIDYPFQDIRFNLNNNATAIAVDQDNDITYVGGFFTRVNTAAHGTVLDPVTALNPHDFPQPNGIVSAVVGDGSGGYYIGGSFTRVGGYDRQYIAHINSMGEVTDWNPSADAFVGAMALGGDILYVAGGFNTIGGEAREYLAAIDANGNATDWSPSVNTTVLNAIAVDGNTIYLAGGFSQINSTSRNRVAALDLNGDLTDWNANVVGGTMEDVVVKDGTVYIVGNFTEAGGETRNNIAAIDHAGVATSWDPSADGIVRTITFDGDIAYIGGDFTNITTSSGTAARNYLAALDMTGEVTSWDPDAFRSSGSFVVYTLSVSDGVVYAGGNFTTVKGAERRGAAAIDTSGNLLDWDPSASSGVFAIHASTAGVYVGGAFRNIGGVARNRLAAFDATGTVTDWDPSPDNTVNAIVIADGSIYIGGSFLNVGGTPQNGLASFDANGELTDWSPLSSGFVQSMALDENDILYVGGSFFSMDGESRVRLASFNPDGTLTSWNPSADDGIVYSVFPDGSVVYVGGAFTSVSGESRNGIAAVDAGTGSVTSWDPGVDGSVFNAIASAEGIVYAGGDFSLIGTESRSNLAALEAGTGNVTSWDPSPNGEVNALGIHAGTIYAGGDFTTIGGVSRNDIAAIDLVGSVESWDLQLTSNVTSVTITTLAISEASILLGGFFTYAGGDVSVNAGSFYVFDETDPVFTSADEIVVAENSSGTIYTAATDEITTLSLGTSKDEGLFSLSGGAISFRTSPNYENPSDGNTDNQYLLDITAVDLAGNSTMLELTVTVTNVDEVAPVITLIGDNPQNIELGNNYAELGATANDDVDGDISGSIAIDATAIDASLLGTYTVTYNVEDATGNVAVEVSRTVNVVDTTAPDFTSATSITVDENTSTSEVVYTAAAFDAGAVAYSLEGTDASSFTLGADSGELTFIESPDFETQSSYSVTITATDGSENSSELAVTIAINDVKEGVVLGLEDAFNVSVYPNPTTNQLSIQGVDLSNYDQLIVSTNEGKQVLSFQDLSIARFDVSALSSGIYMLRLQSDEGMVNAGRIIKK